jgi:ankyrin repeat protein
MSFKIKNTIKKESNNNEINRDLKEFQEECIYLKKHYEKNIKHTLECVILYHLPGEPYSHDGCTGVIDLVALKEYIDKHQDSVAFVCPYCRKEGVKFKKNLIVKNIIGKFLNNLKELLRNAKSKEKRVLFVRLLNETIGINEELGDGNTALHLAIKNKNIKLAELLLKHEKIDLTIKNSNEYTAPELITKNKLWELINELPILNDSKVKVAYGGIFLDMVANKIKGTKEFLEKHKNIRLDWFYKNTGYFAIHYAVINNDVELIKLLLQRSEKLINIRVSKEYPPPLLCNIENKKLNLGTVELLLSYEKINVNAKFKGNTALHLAIKNKNIKLAELLLKHEKIDLTIKNSNGQTSLRMFVKQ